MKPKFTIFTGTYNSEKVINRVFDSIKNQLFRDFEWIVIDDASTDRTVLMVQNFINQIPNLDVKFIIHKKNKGVAFSRMQALDLATGEFFVTWDHDDYQHTNQLEIYFKLWQSHNVETIGCIFGKIIDQHENLLGLKFPTDPYISDYINVHNHYLVGNKENNKVVEHHVCAKTNIYKEVLKYYEENPNLLKQFYPNGGDVWGGMAYLGYNTIYTNQIVRRYYIAEQNRVTMSDAPRSNNPERIYLNKLLWINYWESKMKTRNWNWFLRNHFAVLFYGFLSGKKFFEITSDANFLYSKLILIILGLPAFLLANRYK